MPRQLLGRSRRILVVLLLPVLLVACGGGRDASARSATGAPAAGVSPHSSTAGCRTGGSVQSSTTTLTPTVGGHRRTVLVHVPPDYTGKRAVPLVLNLHGSGSTAAEQEAFSDMDATADADTFIVAYPQGLIASGTGFDWNVPAEPLVGDSTVPAGAADDVSFLTHLVPLLESRYCIDARRVYATGFSGGARMASQLGCDDSGIFAAIALVSGLRLPSPCPSSRPVPVIAFHGTADPVDPYDGHGQAYWTYSVPVAAERWAAHDGCSATPTTSQPAAGTTLTSYGKCDGGGGVELYTLAGEGHEWPGGPPPPRKITKVLGPQSDAVDADAAMWTFFSAHPLPPA